MQLRVGIRRAAVVDRPEVNARLEHQMARVERDDQLLWQAAAYERARSAGDRYAERLSL